MIAALFVANDGPYSNLPNVDPWTEDRDARLYPGPHPVVAHPPCERWGRYWFGGPSVKERKRLGDDLGCFGFALMAVRAFGGVLEHPAATHAWKIYELETPELTDADRKAAEEYAALQAVPDAARFLLRLGFEKGILHERKRTQALVDALENWRKRD